MATAVPSAIRFDAVGRDGEGQKGLVAVLHRDHAVEAGRSPPRPPQPARR